MKAIYTIVGILIILAVLFLLFANDEGVPELSNISKYFQEQVVERGIEEIGGHPIEGFDAVLLMRAYPNMAVEDFDGVETFEGHYVVKRGELTFVRDQAQPISSAEQTVSEKGYQTLLDNISARLNLTVDDEAAVDALLLTLAGEQVAAEVPIENEFEGKIVYGTSGNLDVEALQNDCRTRGGAFNLCGSPCAPDAEICIQVCAFTCEF